MRVDIFSPHPAKKQQQKTIALLGKFTVFKGNPLIIEKIYLKKGGMKELN